MRFSHASWSRTGRQKDTIKAPLDYDMESSFPGLYTDIKKPELLMAPADFRFFNAFCKARLELSYTCGTWPFTALFFRETDPITLGQRLKAFAFYG